MLEQSKLALSKVSIDDAYLDVACFEAQQAIEFLMKAILIDNGIPYNKSHDIRYLLDLLDNTWNSNIDNFTFKIKFPKDFDKTKKDYEVTQN